MTLIFNIDLLLLLFRSCACKRNFKKIKIKNLTFLFLVNKKYYNFKIIVYLRKEEEEEEEGKIIVLIINK